MTTLLALLILNPLSVNVQEKVDQIQNRIRNAQTVKGSMSMYVNDELARSVQFIFNDNESFAIVSGDTEVYQNENTLWIYYPDSKEYSKHSKMTRVTWPKFLGGLQPFVIAKLPVDDETKAGGFLQVEPGSTKEVEWQGKKAIEVKAVASGDSTYETRWYLDFENLVPLGWQTTANYRKIVVVYSDLEYDVEVPRDAFNWSPPKDAVPVSKDSYEKEIRKIKEQLLKPGDAAPSFALPFSTGGTYAFDEEISKSKLTLFTFWFYYCYTCLDELPHLNALHQKYSDRGFHVISVNYNDPQGLIQKVVDEKGLVFPVLMNKKDSETDITSGYRVVMYPTNILVDSDGKVVKSWLGPPDDLEKILKSYGIGS